jgi:hypothetical protein
VIARDRGIGGSEKKDLTTDRHRATLIGGLPRIDAGERGLITRLV